MKFPWLRRQSQQFTHQQRAELESLCSSIADKLRQAGFKTPALSAEPRPMPQNFDKRMQIFKIFDEVVGHHLEDGADVADEKALLWRFVRRVGYTPTSDIFDLITDQDYIEVYDNEGLQIYRSLNYFDLVSFTIEDLVTLNWKTDFKRDRTVLLHLLEVTLRLATGTLHKTYSCAKVPTHNVQEMLGQKYLHELGLKYISPLRSGGKVVAFIATSKARRIG